MTPDQEAALEAVLEILREIWAELEAGPLSDEYDEQ